MLKNLYHSGMGTQKVDALEQHHLAVMCCQVLLREFCTTHPDHDNANQRKCRTIRWVSENLHDELFKLCVNQHERANEVLKRKGGKTSF